MSNQKHPLDRYLWERDISAEKFAAQIGVSPSTISRMRHHGMKPSLTVAIKIERATNGEVTVHSLAGELRDE